MDLCVFVCVCCACSHTLFEFARIVIVLGIPFGWRRSDRMEVKWCEESCVHTASPGLGIYIYVFMYIYSIPCTFSEKKRKRKYWCCLSFQRALLFFCSCKLHPQVFFLLYLFFSLSFPFPYT